MFEGGDLAQRKASQWWEDISRREKTPCQLIAGRQKCLWGRWEKGRSDTPGRKNLLVGNVYGVTKQGKGEKGGNLRKEPTNEGRERWASTEATSKTLTDKRGHYHNLREEGGGRHAGRGGTKIVCARTNPDETKRGKGGPSSPRHRSPRFEKEKQSHNFIFFGFSGQR